MFIEGKFGYEWLCVMCVVFDVVFVKCVKFMCKDIVEVLKMVMGECVEVFCWVFGFVDGE